MCLLGQGGIHSQNRGLLFDILKGTKGLGIVLILFLTVFVLMFTSVGFHYPIYVEGIYFGLDVPDEEFSADDYSSAIQLLEDNGYDAKVDNEPPWRDCPSALKASPSENSRMRIFLFTECVHSNHVFIEGSYAYPMYFPLVDVEFRASQPMIKETVADVVSILGLSSDAEHISFGDFDGAIGVGSIVLHFLLTSMMGLIVASMLLFARTLSQIRSLSTG